METAAHAKSFMLASYLSSYPGEEAAHLFREFLSVPDSSPHVSRLKHALDERVGNRASGWDDLRSEYIDLFDRGSQVNSLHETEYGRARALVKGGQLADIAGFYRAFGFDLVGPSEGAPPEMLDHVAVEFEFYALLLLKELTLIEEEKSEGVDVVREARKKFLKNHLGRFVHAIRTRPGVVQSSFYSKVFDFCSDLVAEECRRMEVTPVLELWVDGEQESSTLTCGSGMSCGVPTGS